MIIKTRIDHEGPVHQAVLTYLRLQLPGALIHHSPNEVDVSGKDIARAISKAKFRGMVVGFPDIIVLWRGVFMGFEVKAKGGKISDAQEAVGAMIQSQGGHWAVVRSVDDVRAVVVEIGGAA